MEAPFDGVMVISQATDKNVAGVVWPDDDATFIAHSREDVEWLVAEVRRLRRALGDPQEQE